MTLVNLVSSVKVKSLLSLWFVFLLLYLIYITSNRDNQCLPQEFRLKGLHSCHPLLTCQDFKDVKIGRLLGFGAVKAVYHAKWKTFDVALSILNDPSYEVDFLSGLQNILELQQNQFTIQAVGFCVEEKMFLTEFHENGDATRLKKVLHDSAEGQDGILLRMNLCRDYAQILSSLHHVQSANGTRLPPRVLCDSNNLEKLLSQLLLTDNLSLILNDLDALPHVKAGGIKCGHQELKGKFVAPEQLWNFPEKYDDAQMTGYDEKTDIWKVPSVCNYFLDGVQGGERVQNLLVPLHERCKSVNPRNRPTANELLEYYDMVKKKLELQLVNG